MDDIILTWNVCDNNHLYIQVYSSITHFIVVILVDWIATFIQISIMNIQSLALNWFLMK